MKVILINPAFSDIYGPYRYAARVGASNQVPLGLCYLAAAVEKEGHEVRLIGCEVEDFASEEELIGQIAAFDPDVVGLTATTPLVARANSIMRRAKQIKPGALTVFGGVHVTVLNMLAFVHSNLASLFENVMPLKPRPASSHESV